MGKAPANTDKKMSVSDVALARSYVADIGGAGKVKAILSNAYSRLISMFPHKNEPDWQWTERRVRSFWNGEAAYVEFREMRELHAAAAKAKEERELLQKARKEHAAFIEKTASLRALLERTDPDFFSPEIEGLRRQSRDMDRTGVGRE
ncbi:hypothetical protein EN828_10340 [Mesorhizobium sp. M2D.F.Ca.ET.185.01.1.1]|uniref:hypothetical protein n=1 Tax=Mesorhizobium sp. M2D.F.Ca.ET.232.01.1.1 TaxID=2496670 RepID=UPI000FD1CD3B|nr:hypothetical protein [Mesorhizobium sp. M2D.F.Ca.ET.232.01.1.1]TGP25916.1 hypothetical protein EN875_034330 [Mesorhizobium sp. M2D.F.Ca.ET.232.01.1.1]TGQ23887.1 hypothetical protein EN863_064580 [Mesorhizobium sp. M00.F.Ca.ET.220.01.1.1]TGS32600.1 hypothetical protein EN828_10340 [Mesorhizobium sp. M2D.F.Ca.ET.185.01.1.1]TGV74805.1 hypothetical protein EN792_057395 [Mesorhizobium sp. M00.F.Ca.ET.149.01.1.1]